MVRKKAQGHVEIILSTVLFIGFLIFVFIFINSSFRTNEPISTRNIEEKLISRISSDVGKLTVIVNTINDCYSLDEVNDEFGDNFTEVQDSNNPRKYTIYYGNFFNESIVGIISCSGGGGGGIEPLGFDDFSFEFETLDGTGIDKNVGIYELIALPEPETPFPVPIEGINFSFGLYLEEELIIYQKIKDLKADYSEYDNLKKSLGVGDFSFEFRNLDGLVIAEISIEGKIPENVDVVSKDFPVRVMNENVEILELVLNIKAWR